MDKIKVKQKIHDLTVEAKISLDGMKKVKWKCSCKCGRMAFYSEEDLLSNTVRNCRKCDSHFEKPLRSIDRPETDSDIYKNWRTNVYKRDKFKCVACGSKFKINAHHLDGWHWSLHNRYDVANGVTLCGGPNGCHKRFHKIYGYVRNTKQQFEEFLNLHFAKTLIGIL